MTDDLQFGDCRICDPGLFEIEYRVINLWRPNADEVIFSQCLLAFVDQLPPVAVAAVCVNEHENFGTEGAEAGAEFVAEKSSSGLRNA